MSLQSVYPNGFYRRPGGRRHNLLGGLHLASCRPSGRGERLFNLSPCIFFWYLLLLLLRGRYEIVAATAAII